MHAQDDVSERYVLLIGGLGGSEQYASTFQQYLLDSRRAFIQQFQVSASNITVLGEYGSNTPDYVTGPSTAENIRAQFAALAGRMSENDHVYIILFGHGSYDGQHAFFNIPRRDLTAADYAKLVTSLNAGRVIFINTASASGPFIEALSGSDRIIITAAKSGTQRNATLYPRFFVEALSSPAADTDKDGRTSVKELFQYAAERTVQWFEERGHLATEHALIEDTGDGRPARFDELEQAADGHLAAITYPQPPRLPNIYQAGTAADSLAQIQLQKRNVEEEIAKLKSRKNQLSEEAYYDQLEELLLRLARLSSTADSLQSIR